MDGGVVFRVRLQEHHGLVVFPGGHLDLRATLLRDGCLGKYHGEKKEGNTWPNKIRNIKLYRFISRLWQTHFQSKPEMIGIYIYASWWEVILTEVPTLQTCLFNQGKSMIHPRTSPFEWQRFRVSTPSKAHNLRKMEKVCNLPLNLGFSDWTS